MPALFLWGSCIRDVTGASAGTIVADDIQMMKSLAGKGGAAEQFKLAERYRVGNGVPESYEEAAYWYMLAANQGLTEAQYNLGVLYANGQGVPKNYEKAFELYQKAAEKDFPEAQWNLAVLYIKGMGVSKDYEKAFSLLNKSANSGIIGAQTNLALLYDEVGNDEQAEKWYRIAAKRGEKVAQYYLGHIYNEGVFLEKDYEKAAFWYSKSASQNFSKAQAALAFFYYSGLGGLPVDKSKAIDLLKKASAQGYAPAQFNLAFIYSKGERELPRDNKKAYAWYSVAYANGLEVGAKSKDEIAKKLTADELEGASVLAREYIEKYKMKKVDGI